LGFWVYFLLPNFFVMVKFQRRLNFS